MEDRMTGFDAFWSAWPANSAGYTRKGCKSECRARWQRMGLEIDADHIVRHVQWLKTTEQWTEGGGRLGGHSLIFSRIAFVIWVIRSFV
jgi:hypothetical protein